MKFILVLISFLMIVSAQASQLDLQGKFYFNAGSTEREKKMLRFCNKNDATFRQGLSEGLKNGDLRIKGIVNIDGNLTIRVYNNQYGEWMETSPLYCNIKKDRESNAIKQEDVGFSVVVTKSADELSREIEDIRLNANKILKNTDDKI